MGSRGNPLKRKEKAMVTVTRKTKVARQITPEPIMMIFDIPETTVNHYYHDEGDLLQRRVRFQELRG